MRPENDIKNPYVLMIYFLSIIPSIFIWIFFNSYLLRQNILIHVNAIMLPILITYWILFSLYNKSDHYKKRYRKV